MERSKMMDWKIFKQGGMEKSLKEATPKSGEPGKS